MMKLWSAILAVMLLLAHTDADARRMGGGRSFGKQSGNVTQRQTQQPAAPTQNAGNKPTNANNAANTAATRKPWGGLLGGLAAGLGLAWLASTLGLGEEFGQILLMGLLAMAIMSVVGMIMRARRPAGAGMGAGGASFAFQGARGSADSATGGAARVQTPPQYSPDNVGNDASARPWERSNSLVGSTLAGPQNWGIPEGFDTEGFLTAAKRNFITLQAAWDRSDIATLRAMMTDGMVDEIRAQLSEREQHRSATQGGAPNQTDVVLLEAQLLGIEDLGADYMASVEFSGMIREEPSAGPSPFREVWNMTKSKSGASGWLVAGVQAL